MNEHGSGKWLLEGTEQFQSFQHCAFHHFRAAEHGISGLVLLVFELPWIYGGPPLHEQPMPLLHFGNERVRVDRWATRLEFHELQVGRQNVVAVLGTVIGRLALKDDFRGFLDSESGSLDVI